MRSVTPITDHQVPRRGYLFLPVVVDSAATEGSATAMEVRYAKSGDLHIAYQTWGDGAVDLVFCPGFVTHIESRWSEPGMARFLRGMGEFARVVMFDKCGTGMSDRAAGTSAAWRRPSRRHPHRRSRARGR